MQKMNLICLVLIAVAECSASISPSGCMASSFGNNFVFGIIGFYGLAPRGLIHLYITSVDQVEAHVRITAPFMNVDKTLNLSNHTIYTLNATQVHFENGTQFKGIEISSDVNISVHVVPFSNNDEFEGFLALPVNALGTRYIASSYIPYSYSVEILIVGVESNTDVYLSPKIDGRSGSNKSFRLQKFESYQFKANADISGSVITSNKPIAVIAGTAYASVPVGSGSGQYLIEQMVPTKYWTSTFVVPPIYPRTHFVLRFFADNDNTEIRYYNSTKHYAVNFMKKGSMEEILFANHPVVIIANKPISVMQYGYNGDNMAGDPFMSTVQGISQYENSYKFVSQNIYSPADTVAITIQKDNVSGLVLNGLSMSNYNVKNMSVPPPMDQYITLFVNISYNSYYHLYHSGGLKFGAVIYGRPETNAAYGYPLKLSMIANDCNASSHMTSTVASVSPVSPSYSKQIGNGNWCFQCEGMRHLELCDNVARCKDENEVCYVQKYPTNLNGGLYRSGCMKTEQCSHAIGCIECCSGDFCNNAGCGDKGLPALGQRGPLCMDCTYKYVEEDCNTVKLCHSNQVCMVAKYEWGDSKFYHRMGCADMQSCSTKRSISQLTTRNVPVCSQCCSTDFCNMNCSSVDTSLSIVG